MLGGLLLAVGGPGELWRQVLLGRLDGSQESWDASVILSFGSLSVIDSVAYACACVFCFGTAK